MIIGCILRHHLTQLSSTHVVVDSPVSTTKACPLQLPSQAWDRGSVRADAGSFQAARAAVQQCQRGRCNGLQLQRGVWSAGWVASSQRAPASTARAASVQRGSKKLCSGAPLSGTLQSVQRRGSCKLLQQQFDVGPFCSSCTSVSNAAALQRCLWPAAARAAVQPAAPPQRAFLAALGRLLHAQHTSAASRASMVQRIQRQRRTADTVCSCTRPCRRCSRVCLCSAGCTFRQHHRCAMHVL